MDIIVRKIATDHYAWAIRQGQRKLAACYGAYETRGDAETGAEEFVAAIKAAKRIPIKR